MKAASVFVQGVMHETHPRKILEGVGAFAHSLPRPWRLRWDPLIPPEAELVEDGVRGVICFHLSAAQLAFLRKRNIPAVCVSGRALLPGVPHVIPDSHALGALAAGHFRKRHHLHHAFIGFEGHLYSKERLEGFMASLDPGGGFQVFLHPEGIDLKRTDPDLRAFLRDLPPRCGVFAANDVCALRVAEAADDLGLRIPEDFSLLGADNDLLRIMASPVPLSSIDPGSLNIGTRAAERLHDLMSPSLNPGPDIERLPPVGVITRASTDQLACEDPRLIQAVKLIRARACGGLTVDELCRELAVGRRNLERRFQANLHTSPEKEIRRVRIDRAAQLLSTTARSVESIASETGYEDPLYFSTAFRKATGLSPRAWRKQAAGVGAPPR